MQSSDRDIQEIGQHCEEVLRQAQQADAKSPEPLQVRLPCCKAPSRFMRMIAECYSWLCSVPAAKLEWGDKVSRSELKCLCGTSWKVLNVVLGSL